LQSARSTTERLEVLSSHFGLKETDMKILIGLIKNTKGATAIEYGLIAALIAVAAISAMQGLGTQLSKTFNNVSNKMSSG